MTEKVEAEAGQTNNEPDSLEKQSKIKRGLMFLGKVAAATAVVCATATPFVYHWAEKIRETVDPVQGTLEEVNKTVGEGSNVIGSKIEGLTTEVDGLTPEPPTTTEPDKPN